MSRSDDLFRRARRVTPGGVHSPVRSFMNVDGTPLFIRSAAGATLTDEDGKNYTDFCMAFGPLILGHAHPAIKEAATDALNRGWSFGAAEAGSLRLAELITDNIAWVDSVRFVNSGTEAVMTALRLARAATGRDRILKFDGCYHGHTDAMLLKAGSGLAGTGEPGSAGITAGVMRDTLVAQLDDEESLEEIFRQNGDSLAAAIIEPVPANHGLLPQRHIFLENLARLCRQYGALLIFDEVISGFRLSFGGFTETSGLNPDLVTWGKVIGGGFPVGAIAGATELMNLLAPHGKVYQAGTLSANPVAMAAGLATLEILRDESIYSQLELLGRKLDDTISAVPNVYLQRYDSLFWIVHGTLSESAMIRSVRRVPANIKTGYKKIFRQALASGVYLPPSAYEIGFLSTAHTEADIDQLGRALS